MRKQTKIWGLLLALTVFVLIVSGCGCKHEWQEATCTAPKTCKICGLTEGEPNGHSVELIIVQEPTCAEDGKRSDQCEICNEMIEEAIPMLTEHTVEIWSTVKEATCTDEGGQEGVCSVCGETQKKSTAKIEHIDDNNWVVVSQADAYSDGVRATHCTVCGTEMQNETFSLTMEQKMQFHQQRVI